MSDQTTPVLDAPENKQATEQATEQTTVTPDDYKALNAKYERAQADIAKFKTRQAEVQAAQKEAEAKSISEKAASEQLEIFKTKNAELEASITEAKQAAKRAEWKVQLSQHVADPNAALKLLDVEKHITDEGVNIEALLTDYPILKPQAASLGGGSRQSESSTQAGRLTKSDFVGKSQEWINANWHRLTG